jgi:Tol biopolymer transport system component
MKRGLALLAAAVAIGTSAASGRASSPSRIVFAADRAPSVTGEIYRLGPDGRRVDLSKSPYQDTDPAVSPDGKRVAFVSDRGGRTTVYEVASDGRGLVRTGPNLHPLPDAGCIPQLAWQPHGDVLAVGACSLNSGSLWIVRRGRKPLKLLHGKNGIQGTSWSADGRVLVASQFSGVFRAFSATGRPLWRVNGGCCGAWSSQGLVAVAATGVYDEAGRLRFELQHHTGALRFSWSPDGRFLAVSWSGNANWLEVLTTTGAREFTRRIPGGNLAWAGNSTVVVGYPQCSACAKTVGFDARTGKESRASNRWLDPLSADRNLAIVTPSAKNGTPFKLGVAPPSGGALKTYARIGGCYGDGDWLPAITSPQLAGRSIVYQSWGECDEPYANLYSIGSDGSGLHRLTNVEAQETQPAVSPDGSETAYVWADANGLSCKGCSDGIRIANADGTALRTLTDPEDCTFDDSPTWSPDGSTILFSEDACDTPGELFTMPAAGGTAHDLGIAGSEPAWGPSRIGYVGSDQSDRGLWTANPDGSDRVLVSKLGSMPAWSSDGRLAYLLGDLYHRTLVVGSSQAKLQFARVTSLAWTPDGTRVVITASKTKLGPSDLYTVTTNGTDPVRLTSNFGVSSG